MERLKESRPRIIIIDDNPAIHEDFRKILVSDGNVQDLSAAASAFFGTDDSDTETVEKLDVELDSAHQGEEGYEKVRAAVGEGRPYTLAFCDMRMPPGWDGLKTIEMLWEADPNLQVVICSAYSDNTWADISERLGRSDRLLILKKPFDNAEVLQMAVALIEKRRLIETAYLKREELENTVAERTRHLDEARKESEQLLAAIDSLMVGTDSAGVVHHWNASAAGILGIEAGEAIGQPFNSLPIRWEDREILTRLLGDHPRESSVGVEARLDDATGAQRIVSFSSYPVCDGDQFQGTLILGTDLTEHRILEQQLQNAQKLESVGQLAAGVAHEINTPMQYVGDNLDYLKNKFEKLVGFLQNAVDLLDSAEDEGFRPELVSDLQQRASQLKLQKLFDQIPSALNDSIDGVGHVSRIVRAMKELSHPGGVDRSSVDINRALKTMMTVSTNEWKYVADMETDLAPELGQVAGFPGELNQVFLNLIINAAHAISDVTDGGNRGRGKIILRSSQQKDRVRVEIADTGGGIPEAIRDRIFDPFFTTKVVGKGTGQGLAIAHSVIVQKHGGNLSFEVEEGVGTTFIIELPVGDCPKAEETAAADELVTQTNN